MPLRSNYKNTFRTEVLRGPKRQNRSLPSLSTNLDSIRTYNFEIRISGPLLSNNDKQSFILGAKKVTSSGHKIEPIAVRRLNDTFYYPGGADSDELIITFDHQLETKAVDAVYTWLKNGAYNPETGLSPQADLGKQTILDIMYLDSGRNVSKVVSYFGCFPVSFKPSEHNYNTNNEFHTFEATFRYDFMTYFDKKKDFDQAGELAGTQIPLNPVEDGPNG